MNLQRANAPIPALIRQLAEAVQNESGLAGYFAQSQLESRTGHRSREAICSFVQSTSMNGAILAACAFASFPMSPTHFATHLRNQAG
jgi:hypothetical protein